MSRQYGVPAWLAMTFASQALLAQAGAVSFDFSPIDKTVPPCQDLYRHACGAWLTNTKLPPGWDDWMELTGSMGRTADAQRRIVEAAAKPDAGRDGLTQKIGDYYAACLDTGTIEAKGSGPLQEELQRIRSIRSVRELMDEVARLIPLQLNLLYSVSAARDDTGINVLQVMPPSGGMLTLDGGGAGGEGQGKESGRGKTDPKLVALGAFVTTTLQLAGMDYASVESAKGMLAKLQSPLGDPALRAGSDDEILTLGAAERAMPHLNWRGLYALYRIPADARMRIYAPQYFRNLDRQMVRVPLAYWKTILTLSYLVTLAMQPAPILPQAFLDARSRMAQVLGKELEAPGGSREEQCLNRVKEDLGDAVGRKYVEQELPAWEKKKVEEMVEDMRAAMKEQIEGSAWLSADVKRQALVKLAALRVGVGYPEVWKDYSGVLVDRQDAYGNQFRVQQMETARWMSQIGRPPDKRWWEGTPIANDLYYQPERNAVELSACELLAAYDPGRPDAFNYAALGGGIGHELSHAFDNSRRQFDAQGMARDWWTAQDAKEYAGRAQCFAAQYSRVTVVDGLHIDGTRTLDESMADNAGIAVAYRALAKRLAMRGQRMDDPAAGEQGYTPAELFFLGWAIARCEKITPDAVRREVNTDTHPPVPARINLPAANSPAFREAFGCQAGAPMAPVPACGLW